MTATRRTVLAHPASAYLVVVFLVVCVTALQQAPIALALYLIPVLAGWYVARIATIVSDQGLAARGLIGSASMDWAELRGLQLAPSGAVYAVDQSGAQLRLPCVRSTKLGALISAADGRIPDPGAS